MIYTELLTPARTAQQNDWDERERSWKQFRASLGNTSRLPRGRLARGLTIGGR